MTDPYATQESDCGKRAADVLTRRVTRRDVLQSVGLGATALALTGSTLSSPRRIVEARAQVDDASPSDEDEIPDGPAGETVAERAALLDNDPRRIFRFVADEIHYEPYSGLLRGAQGTLWARAGNSVDQAVLLAELLAAAGITCRFATGALPNDAMERLLGLANRPADAIREAYDVALAGAVIPLGQPDGVLSAVPVKLTADERVIVDYATQQADAIRERAATLIDATITPIADALERANITLPALPNAIVPELERERHTWIQATTDGVNWTDLDPTFPGTEPGAPLAAPTVTVDSLPDDLRHWVRVRLTAESIIGGVATRRDVLSYESASERLVNTPIALAMTSEAALSGIGLTIGDAFSGTASFVPCLLAGDDYLTADTPLIFGASGGGGILDALSIDDGSGLADGETLGVWLSVEVISPDSVPLTAERTLMDRVGVTARVRGDIDLDALAPLEFVLDEAGQSTLPELSRLTLFTVDVARLPSLYATRDAQSAYVFGRLHEFGPAIMTLRNQMLFEHGARFGFDGLPAGPNLTAFSVHLIDPSREDSEIEIATDILTQRFISMPLLDERGSEPISPYLAMGVFNQVAEQVLMETLVTASDGEPEYRLRPTVGMIFEEAERAGVEIAVVTSRNELAGVSHADEAITRVQRAVDQGLIVVIPRQAVMVGATSASGWWFIDPTTGQTWDEVEDGRGFAGARLRAGEPTRALPPATSASEKGLLWNRVKTWARPYTALGLCVGAVIAAAVRASDYTGAGGPVGSFIETFKNVDPTDAKGCVGG